MNDKSPPGTFGAVNMHGRILARRHMLLIKLAKQTITFPSQVLGMKYVIPVEIKGILLTYNIYVYVDFIASYLP